MLPNLVGLGTRQTRTVWRTFKRKVVDWWLQLHPLLTPQDGPAKDGGMVSLSSISPIHHGASSGCGSQVGSSQRFQHHQLHIYIYYIYIYMYVCICVCNVLIEPFSLKGKIWDMGSIDFWRMYGYKYLYMCIHQPTTLLSKRGLGGLEFQHFLPQWKTDLLKSQQDDGRNPYLKNWDILEERHNNSLSKIFRPLKVR